MAVPVWRPSTSLRRTSTVVAISWSERLRQPRVEVAFRLGDRARGLRAVGRQRELDRAAIPLVPATREQAAVDDAGHQQNYVEHPDGALAIPTIHRDLALHMSASQSINADQLRWLFGAFRTGALLLVAEVAAWVVNLSVAA